MDARRTPQRIVNTHPPDQRAQVRVDLGPASKGAGFPTPVMAKAGRCQRTRVSGRMIVMALSIDGNHRYSRTKNKRSPFVSWTRPRTLRCSTISCDRSLTAASAASFNQRCALTPDLESILRTQTGKILL